MWLNGMFRNDSDLASQSTSNLECQPLDSGYFHSIHTLLPRNLFLIWPRIVIIADYYTLKTHQHLYPARDTKQTLFGLPSLTAVKISFDSESEVTVNENTESTLKKNMDYFQPSSTNSGYSDVGDIVMLVTLWWWPIRDVGDRIIMLVIFFVMLVIFPMY